MHLHTRWLWFCVDRALYPQWRIRRGGSATIIWLGRICVYINVGSA